MKTFLSSPTLIWFEYILNALPTSCRGKRRLLSVLHNRINRGSYCFPWEMENGLNVAISNREVTSKYGVGGTCFSKRVWEPHVEHTIEKLLNEGDIALDIGANIGYFSAVMARKVGLGGKVIAFEPTPETAIQLNLTKLSNGAKNLSIQQLGLGSHKHTAIIEYDPAVSGNASLYRRQLGTNTIKSNITIETLDSLFENKQLPLCQFIKLDVEGHELQVLNGGLQYLSASKPLLLYEFNAETADLAGYCLQDIVKTLHVAFPGCKHFVIWGEGHLVSVDIASISVPKGCHIDLIAIPKERLEVLEQLKNQ
jgi:FkbM family methyltransferase